jgi:hypothetical protein
MDQLGLVLLTPTAPTLPSSAEQPLVAALAELLIAVASENGVEEGGHDEREDP